MTDTQIVVQRTIDAPAHEIFDVLSNPVRHVDLDTSGFVRSLEHGDRIKEVGDVFTMNMEGDHMGGEYRTDNHVVGFDDNRLLAWKTAPAGVEPPGWQWVYTLESTSPDATELSLTYDWSAVTDQALLEKVGFPLISRAELQESLAKLAETVAGS